MALTTTIGLILAFIVIVGSISTQGGLGRVMMFIDLGSFILVMGATIASLIVNYTFKELWGAIKAVRFAFASKPQPPEEIIDILVKMAVKARKGGFISLRDEDFEGKFQLLNLGIGLLSDGTDPEVTREILETASATETNQFAAHERIWRDMAVYGPMFGMLGTLVGLVLMLRGLSDPASIGPAMSLALVTTFYGIVIAGVLCLPIAGKIHNYSERMIMIRMLIIEGLLSIQDGDNSQIVEERLRAYLPKDTTRSAQKKE